MVCSAIRRSIRGFSTASFVEDHVPGVRVHRGFLGKMRHNELKDKTIDLYRRILKSPKSSPSQLDRSFLFTFYDSSIVRVEGEKIAGEYNSLGSGSRVAWFTGNSNIPECIRQDLIAPLLQIPEVKQLNQKHPLHWNLTLQSSTMDSEIRKKEKFDLMRKEKKWEWGILFSPKFPAHQFTMSYSFGPATEYETRMRENPLMVRPICYDADALVLYGWESCAFRYNRSGPWITGKEVSLFDGDTLPIGSISLMLKCSIALSGINRARELMFSEKKESEFTDEEKDLIERCRKIVPSMRFFGRPD
jgi:hypothetical protein